MAIKSDETTTRRVSKEALEVGRFGTCGLGELIGRSGGAEQVRNTKVDEQGERSVVED